MIIDSKISTFHLSPNQNCKMFLWVILAILSFAAYYFYRKSLYTKKTKDFKEYEYIAYGIERIENMENPDELIIIVPGNPGIPEFYMYFADQINKKFQKPVVIVGLAGHSLSQPYWFGLSLKEQILHFKRLMDKLKDLYPNIKISLIGHSIGGYVCLNLCKYHDFEKIYLLFPTLSYMVKSSNGKQPFYHLVCMFRYVINIFFFCMEFVPLFLMNPIINLLEVLEPSIHEFHEMLIPQLIQFRLLNNVFTLLRWELNEVLEMQHELIEQNLNCLNFYYASSDHWIPDEVPSEMKQLYPKNVTIDTNGTKHAFVTTKKDIETVLKYLKF